MNLPNIPQRYILLSLLLVVFIYSLFLPSSETVLVPVDSVPFDLNGSGGSFSGAKTFDVPHTLTEKAVNIAELETHFPLVRYMNFPLFVRTNISLCINNTGSIISYPDGFNSSEVIQNITVNGETKTLNPDEINCFEIGHTSFQIGMYPIIAQDDEHSHPSNGNNTVSVFLDVSLTDYKIEIDYKLLQSLTLVLGFVVLVLWPLSEIKKRLDKNDIFAY